MATNTVAGFVGLGMMGLPMAEHLAASAGMDVRVYDQSAARIELLHAHPAWGHALHAVSSLRDLAVCDVVITMLPNSAVTDAVVLGDPQNPGLCTVLKASTVVVDMGSSDPVRTRELAQRMAKDGITLLDAPVSGSVAKARSGTLSIMVGGPDAAFDRVRAVLQAMGSQLIRTGEVGSAHAMKALNNYVYAAGLLATSEALLVARRMGLDLNVFADVLNASSGRNVATETKLRQFMISREFNGGFALGLQAKDLATARGLQQATGVKAPQMNLCADLWKQAVNELEVGVDNTAILRLLERHSGIDT
ncbi:MAG: NAD(P)-dependent oxidoreductase [Hydrogenophaga sp.]|uniref:NAD(P)-dependent oxidoreductase n=1 Tax=Hydrogenophaga sp. TaxID=1904254 RepID=UPI003D0CBF3D